MNQLSHINLFWLEDKRHFFIYIVLYKMFVQFLVACRKKLFEKINRIIYVNALYIFIQYQNITKYKLR